MVLGKSKDHPLYGWDKINSAARKTMSGIFRPADIRYPTGNT